jgi:imidazolonepropionase-like amidohydrolase
MRKCLFLIAILFFSLTISAQQKLSDYAQQFVAVGDPVIAITHVRIIDGTGAAPRENQTVIVKDGRIEKVGDASTVQIPKGARLLNRPDHTLLPGLVGMHDHLYYTASLALSDKGTLLPPGFFLNEIPFTAPRLYLAAGVTTIRTTGSVDPFTDLSLKRDIDGGVMPGPKMHLTAPYLESAPGAEHIPQMYELKSPADAQRFVAFWADSGFTSLKAYMNITHAQLKAAVDEAHKRGLKVTAHLCSIGYVEAAEIGVDNLEHGFAVDTEFAPSKQPDKCPSQKDAIGALLKLEPNDPAVQRTFRTLIDKHIAVTSTLPVFESGEGHRPPPQKRVLDAMSPESRSSFLTALATRSAPDDSYLKKTMQLEYAFAKAGGTLLAGCDPTGNGGVLPGFGDQRQLELLVEAGFTPVEAIKIATFNGAQFLGVADRIGTIAEGKQADLVLVHGNPADKISDIEGVELVFKDGVGFDSQKLIDSVRGQVGIR